jgi:hypothetical protein
MTWREYDEMMDELMQIEIDAFNTPDGEPPESNNEAYKKYLDHGWI